MYSPTEEEFIALARQGNLVPVTLGNILGGVVFVAFAYWYIHLKADGRRSS